MKKNLFTIGTILFLFSCNHSKHDTAPGVNATQTPDQIKPAETFKNYLNVPGPIQYGGKEFVFSWSSNPSEGYFKQEYIPGGDVTKKYTEMVLLELALDESVLKDVVMAKLQEIVDRQSYDANAKYEVSQDKQTGEYVVDFIMSENYGSQNAVTEWDFYRYSNYLDPSGKKGVLLMGLSRRAYGMKGQEFITDILANGKNDVTAFAALKVPDVKPAN